MALDFIQANADAAKRLARGRLLAITPAGELLVELECEGEAPEPILCGWLQTGQEATLHLQPGDPVLVLPPSRPKDLGCVVGRIGAYLPPRREAQPGVGSHATRPELLTLEAEEQIVLRCGDSTIILRHDGKILIKGIDVLSRASRTQRLKGGSVQIN